MQSGLNRTFTDSFVVIGNFRKSQKKKQYRIFKIPDENPIIQKIDTPNEIVIKNKVYLLCQISTHTRKVAKFGE